MIWQHIASIVLLAIIVFDLTSNATLEAIVLATLIVALQVNATI